MKAVRLIENLHLFKLFPRLFFRMDLHLANFCKGSSVLHNLTWWSDGHRKWTLAWQQMLGLYNVFLRSSGAKGKTERVLEQCFPTQASVTP